MRGSTWKGRVTSQEKRVRTPHAVYKRREPPAEKVAGASVLADGFNLSKLSEAGIQHKSLVDQSVSTVVPCGEPDAPQERHRQQQQKKLKTGVQVGVPNRTIQA